MAENAASLLAGALDAVQVFQPYAEELIASGAGHLWYAAASRGLCSYTTFYARHETLAAKHEDCLKLVRGLYQAQRWLHREPPEALGEAIRPYFPNVPQSILHASLARYKALGVWGRDPRLPQEGYERLVRALVNAGFAKGTPYETAVDNSLAEQVVREVSRNL